MRIAVAAQVRHEETGYGDLLARGAERPELHCQVRGEVDRVLARWRSA